jgi:hypothetical protein
MQPLPHRFVQQVLSGFCGGQVPTTGSFAVCVQWMQGTEIVFEAEVFLQCVGRDGGISVLRRFLTGMDSKREKIERIA